MGRPVYARHVDGNQARVVKELRARGLRVRVLSGVGDGIPDLLVSYRGRFYLIEVKDKGGSLTAAQEVFFAEFEGCPAFVVFNAQQALDAIGVK